MAIAALKLTGVEPFVGDAHTFLIFCYRHPDLPIETRIHAATAALPFERPRLASTTVTHRRPSEMSDDELAAATADADAEAAALEKVLGITPPAEGTTKH